MYRAGEMALELGGGRVRGLSPASPFRHAATGNLWFAIGNHAAWDWGETFLFGTPNSGLRGQHVLMNPSFHGPTLLSGGTDGPEGSVLVLLSEGLIVVLVAIIYRRRRFPLITDRALVEDDVPRSA